ncbi:hypothetical protein [Rodentibacter caecimuris]|uniref:hypothetical protein n=1 Tax=Rodentibacter caecimuris TaxID=1796644 RepID=UPI000985DAE3|nr:hypothetical protein BKG97_01955 [Rodentibacter heylii]
MKINKTRNYDIQSHPQGLGYVAVEYINGKKVWISQNHCDKSLCETEIAKRKQRLAELNLLNQTKNRRRN